SQYINRLGQKILKAAGPQYFHYHFFVIDNKEFNAFAAPSGLIFVHSGLLEAMDSEDELVGVLAHEIGHVTSRHVAQQMAKSSKLSIGTAALILAGIALGGGALSQALMAGGMAAGASMNLKFSREDEEEADRLAFSYMEKMGRDPHAMESMLRKIRNLGRYQPSIPPYLLTHPEPDLRLHYVQDLLLTEKRTYPAREDFDFLRIKYRVLSRTGDPISQLPLLQQKAQNGKPGNMAYYGLSQLYQVTANFEKSEEMLRKVILAHPDKPILTADLGVLRFEAGRFQEALTFFRKARAAMPDSAYASFYLASTLQQLGQLAEAGKIYQSLLPELPDYSRLFYQLSRLRAAQGHTEEAYYYLGVYHWQEGEPKIAKHYLKQAIAKQPTDHEIHKQAEDLIKKIDRLAKL
ncbi:MAG: M48 family metalloprotease, partial [Deltaproteobacteria bacterium]